MVSPVPCMSRDSGSTTEGVTSKATQNMEATVNSMKGLMQRGKNEFPVQRNEVELDGNPATLLKSEAAGYDIPCTVITTEYNRKQFLIMLSISNLR